MEFSRSTTRETPKDATVPADRRWVRRGDLVDCLLLFENYLAGGLQAGSLLCGFSHRVSHTTKRKLRETKNV